MQDLRLGVIGLGLRSMLADEAHRPGRGSVVAAVCDSDPAVLSEASRRFGDPFVAANHEALLARDDVDAVLILTPDFTHERLAIDSLRAGKPAYLEKPMHITIEGCDRILLEARRTGTRLYVGHNMRHMGVVAAMRRIILSGAIGVPRAVWVRHFVGYGGDFYFKDWHADRRNTTGLLLQKAAHDIDVIHWLAGGYTRRVNALGDLLVYGDLPRREAGTPRPAGWLEEYDWPPTARTGLNSVVDVEDVSVMNMQLDNGVIAAYQQCHFSPDYHRSYTVIGTEGRLENFGDGPGDLIKVWNSGPSDYREHADVVHRVPDAVGAHGGADVRILAEFCRFVREGGVTETSPIAARMSVAAGYLATQSLRNGGTPYDVPPLDPDLIAYFEEGQS